MGHQGARVASPEDDHVYVLGPKGDNAYLVSIAWIRDGTVPFPESLNHPLRIEGRDIGPSARADDHGSPPVDSVSCRPLVFTFLTAAKSVASEPHHAGVVGPDAGLVGGLQFRRVEKASQLVDHVVAAECRL